jgi:AAA domain-containing protein
MSWGDDGNPFKKPTDQTVILKRGNELTMEKIDWFWPGWLGRGKFHLLAGNKGAGKSTVLFDLMARLTAVTTWPDNTQVPKPGADVMVWSGEDGIRDTILPRFVAAGGDRARIYFPTETMEDGANRPFDPSTDIEALTIASEGLTSLGMVMIDPVVLALPNRADSHKNAEARRGLQPLVDFAEKRRIAVVGITHFTKGTHDRDPVERVTGSLAFGALPRCIWGASADEDGNQRRLVRVASNINRAEVRLNTCCIKRLSSTTIFPHSELIGAFNSRGPHENYWTPANVPHNQKLAHSLKRFSVTVPSHKRRFVRLLTRSVIAGPPFGSLKKSSASNRRKMARRGIGSYRQILAPWGGNGHPISIFIGKNGLKKGANVVKTSILKSAEFRHFLKHAKAPLYTES